MNDARSLAAACLLLVALAGCGGSDDSETEPTPPPPPPRPETVDHLADLPDGWRRYVNRAGGFAVGLPRGWRASRRGTGSLVRSYDRLVAISILPDRSAESLEIPVDEFADRALVALPGFEDRRGLGPAGRFRHRYRAARVDARGRSRGGIEQRLSTIVLRRDHLATFTVLIAANARRASRPSERLAERVVRTLRSRPPRARGAGGQRGSDREQRRGRDGRRDGQRSGRSG